MTNELLFILMTMISLTFVMLAFRLGKTWLIALIAINAVLMNIFAMKGMYLFGFAATGGNIMYASIFLAADLLNEYYNKKEARRAVMIGFFGSIFFLITTQLILRFIPADYDVAQKSFTILFTLAPRIVIGSMVAYLISQNLDVWIFSKIKKFTGGKHLWLRNNASTWTSQLVDSIIFSTIAFAGVYPLFELIAFTYIIKVLIATIDTPFIYLSKKIKPEELNI